MNTLTKTCRDIELYRVKLLFADTRIDKRAHLHTLIDLLEQHGQQAPVIVTPEQDEFILIDGYLRLQALKRLGHDTVMAEVWSCSPEEALLQIFANQPSRPFEAIEEGMLLSVLQQRYQLSLEKIAHRIGRDKSWVSRRLTLVNELPDEACQAIMSGRLSSWSASRVIAPLARANSAHGTQFVHYLQAHSHSTRELNAFYQHYISASRNVRQQMVNEPALFFKTWQINNKGPEQQWLAILSHCQHKLQEVIELIPQIFYPDQQDSEQKKLINAWWSCHQTVTLLHQQIRSLSYVRTPTTSNDSHPAPTGQESS